MAVPGAADAPSFKELERHGWGAKAGDYDAFAGQITIGAVDPLLDATSVGAGTRLLDVASGPGYVAAGAAARGAQAIGVDFAANMVAEARHRFPGIDFREGDAENLTFDAGSFDAVTCGFGLLHIADPDKAIAEACRVLRPGGRCDPPRRATFRARRSLSHRVAGDARRGTQAGRATLLTRYTHRVAQR